MTDYLIIGSGVAGLNCALFASKFGKVLLTTKDKLEESNTFYAQGGLAAVFGKDDSFEAHVEDTYRAGDGITNKKTAKILVRDAPNRVLELKKLGVKFNSTGNFFNLSREAVHSRARIVHAKDITGEEIVKTLSKHAKKKKNIEIKSHFLAFDRCLYFFWVHVVKHN